ncbi:unnamed protein product [Diplocarpon coronariae]|uniref:Glycosyltransferase family 8 protein n=1 Tax=Diplocarpon coronariae TaxID=2795749 RepID=A0A218ZHR4_9HELO|nr:acetylglucosaminyltransferase [Diplocarpon mali]OWP06706.1 glycosyltransferase family 8 protein [Marssonina coronariae]
MFSYRSRRKAKLTVNVLVTIVIILYIHFSLLAPVKYDPKYGTLKETSASSRFAIATFLCENYVEGAPDFYFTGARLLNYQLNHALKTKLNRTDVSFLVLATHAVSDAKTLGLERDGAKVVVVDDVPLPWWVRTYVKKWKDQFVKLRLYEMVEYERILFIDADTLITRPIDAIFDEKIVQLPAVTMINNTRIKNDEAMLPANYMFAARSDNAITGEREHPYPPIPTEVFSAGFWMAAPSHETFAYLMSVMRHWRRFNPVAMEQSLLNYAFRRDGPMPWFELDPQWSATWPNMRDRNAGVATLHEKLWNVGPDELRTEWNSVRLEMEQYFGSRH